MSVRRVGHSLTGIMPHVPLRMDKELDYMELGWCIGARIYFGPRTLGQVLNLERINLVPSSAPQVSSLGGYLEVRHLSLNPLWRTSLHVALLKWTVTFEVMATGGVFSI